MPQVLRGLRIPAVAAPLFIISVPKLVIAQCKAGIIGSFPALNAREAEGDPPLLDQWLTEIAEELDRHNQANPDRPSASITEGHFGFCGHNDPVAFRRVEIRSDDDAPAAVNTTER